MLSLTKKSEYALVAVCHLARAQQSVTSARQIAEQHAVPLPLLMNVLKKLGHAGQVRSVRGARGGYQLAVRPEQLTLSEVIEAVEGPLHLVECVKASSAGRGCKRSSCCSIRRPVHRLHQRLVEFFGRVTVADLAFDEEYAENLRPRASAKAVGR